MTQESEPLSLSDFFKVCKWGKKSLLFGALLGMSCAAAFTLSRPVLYEAEASFIDKGTKGDRDSHPLTVALMQGNSTKKSAAIPILTSRTLMEELIQENGLQATVQMRSFPQKIARRIWSNFAASYAYLMNSEYPLVKVEETPFKVMHVQFPYDTPLLLTISLKGSNTFDVHDLNHRRLGTGIFGQPFVHQQLGFVLDETENSSRGTYVIKLKPLARTAESYLKNLVVKPDKEIPSLILLRYYDRDRMDAPKLLNRLMTLYTGYLKRQHQTLVDEQLAYLQARQQAMGEELQQMMEEHANILSSEFSSVGFPDAEQAMNFLAQSMQECKQKFLSAKFEMRHFQDMQKEEEPSRSFHGINLATAKELAVGYNQELGHVEAAIAEHTFMRQQLADPTFEISSLSSVLSNPVSSQIIAKASQLELSLHDAHNRMPAEQMRIKGELDTQKQFLSLHLEQTLHLLHLRQELLQNKIVALQNAMRKLTEQEIAILETHQQELQQEIAQLPKKWVSEKLLHQQMQINQTMVDELIKLTDSKNLARNLEVVQSTPIDLAVTPLHPRNPHLLLFMLIGALFGTSFALFFILCRFPVALYYRNHKDS